MKRPFGIALALAASAFAFAASPAARAQDAKPAQPVELLNASYDVARELFAAINPVFAAEWQAKNGQKVEIKQSHAGTSAQARAILEGLQADVVTFNQVTDVEILHDRGNLVAGDWQKRLPNAASPFYSLPAFLVRKDNPKGIKDWNDLIRSDVKVIFPNPKTSGNARYTYLAAYAYALDTNGGDQAKAQDFVRQLFANVPVFDTGGRGATTTFVERNLGDVLITFESEVNGIRREYGDKGFQVIVPPISLLAEFPVSVVDKVVDRKGTRAVATAYLEFLYTDKGQDILASFFNRVHAPAVIAKYKEQFPEVRLVKVEDVFGGWAKVQKEHFASGGILDKVFVNR
ncbi:thiosulfate ABC transporter substrate-binding protein CysP [Chelatococcus asaccharovorans]|uniref:thiosulfate ABC transporter substrate-binding protein CysP n=1 Tax=Chelatococcus asaccharovorans TaxID=28210 RepID=UPI00224C671E|nr:thiosulfate ABC transporter substrate-binding protein CysP [Chelatococcus asaccharovorans]CAH1662552.1 thiosulfate/sulfate ABC transporter periplasmic binding protein CysP [Chelatococcus asaccharovorans]CAH1683139.1 thiosulfate/sulfate ABC transporter periplasmic binding protein CysP [Chelatococcus asaccharovorans]